MRSVTPIERATVRSNVVSAIGRSVEDKGDDKGHSGRLLLRMPRALHAELARVAERQGVSLNHLIVGLLSRSVENDEGTAGSIAPAATTDGKKPLGLGLHYAIVVNLVVLVVAGAIAIALLIVAWRGGF